MTEGKVTKNNDEILAQLEGIWLSFKAFVHVQDIKRTQTRSRRKQN